MPYLPKILNHFLLMMLALAGNPLLETTNGVEEYTLKAVYLERLSRFVQWPGEKVQGAGDRVTIMVVGVNPFGDKLEKIAALSQAGRRSIKVRYCTSIEHLPQCHILFVARSERENLNKILDTIQGRAILTVGDFQGFAEAGGHINFRLTGKKLSLEINQQAVAESRLSLSYLLLMSARIVNPTEPTPRR